MEVNLCQIRGLSKFDRHLLIGMPEHPILKVFCQTAEIFVGPLKDGFLIKDLSLGVISRHVEPEFAEWKIFRDIWFDAFDSGLRKSGPVTT